MDAVMTLAGAAPDPVDGAALASVQVWFGEHLVIDWTGPAADAPGYAEAMRRRFASLRVDGPRPVAGAAA